MNIYFLSLHTIDKNEDTTKQRDIKIEDAQNYVQSLIKKLISNESKREFEIVSESYVANNVKLIAQSLNIALEESASTLISEDSTNVSGIETPCKFIEKSNLIATKFLNAQKKSQEKYGAFTDIKSGGLIQGLALEENYYIYVISFIDHSSFIDENDLLEKIGLPKDKATLKSAIFYLDLNFNFDKIYLSDSRINMTEYWYDYFLELKETRTDIVNTKNAYNHIAKVLSKSLYSKDKPDFIALKNALDVYFSHQKEFNLNSCIEFMFSNYQAQNDSINIEELKRKIRKNDSIAQRFDSEFIINIHDIERKLKNQKFELTDNIELKLKNPKENLQDYLYSTTIDDEKVLVIKNISEKAFNLFK
ncbi:hypothetical protein QTH27_03915 [Clostridium perfringens]|uniref:hypothetical protein n=1 Tax=Clostridium perfringens TaxID=1502 RepID=UPI001CAD2BB5|nr:hypothetical protein [Clostridium perfringens]MDM0471102.1 hypothetical protein [Clostridium perfringens]MDM0476929.1 hypothetical protein [Clostridium perfringens]MDM0479762.1 hypothetical protein [Clostridium perfringens]MDM0484929.1 hypothetical protein [Clostridium perfringens]STB56003.1 Uncharacterised protein [Clostridium perfringens]